MANPDARFLLFSALVILVFHLNRRLIWRQTVLLIASLVFLATFSRDYRAFGPFIAYILLGFAGLHIIRRTPRSAPLVIGLFVALFAWLKRYAFFPGFSLLPFPYVTVGFSYILFRVVQLMIEGKEGPFEQPVTFGRYLIYTLNFTTLVAGPIQRWDEFARMQFREEAPRLTLRRTAAAIERIITGLFQTNVMALIFSSLRSRALDAIASPGSDHLLWGATIFASYPLFLYCNFSGYIDIVLGIADLLGVTLPENFNRPFFADSFIGFWSRWHITLSEWLKTYVYSPLLMSLMRRHPSRALENVWAVLAFFFTFFLVGVWHGQTAEFLFFGVLQGLGVSMNKLWQIFITARLGRKGYKALSNNPWYIVMARGLTFTWFTFTLIWFWSTWRQMGEIVGQLGAGGFVAGFALIFVASSVILTLWEAARNGLLAISPGGSPVLLTRYWRTAWSTALAVILIAVSFLSNQAAPDIVYKTF